MSDSKEFDESALGTDEGLTENNFENDRRSQSRADETRAATARTAEERVQEINAAREKRPVNAYDAGDFNMPPPRDGYYQRLIPLPGESADDPRARNFYKRKNQGFLPRDFSTVPSEYKGLVPTQKYGAMTAIIVRNQILMEIPEVIYKQLIKDVDDYVEKRNSIINRFKKAGAKDGMGVFDESVVHQAAEAFYG